MKVKLRKSVFMFMLWMTILIMQQVVFMPISVVYAITTDFYEELDKQDLNDVSLLESDEVQFDDNFNQSSMDRNIHANLDYSTFDHAGFIDASGSILNPELLPSTFITVSSTSNSAIYINGILLEGFKDLAVGDHVSFQNLVDNRGRLITCNWTITHADRSFARIWDTFRISVPNPSPSADLTIDSEYIFQENNTKVNVPVVFNFRMQFLNLTVNRDDFYAIFVRDDLNPRFGAIDDTNPDTFVFNRRGAMGNNAHPANLLLNSSHTFSLSISGGTSNFALFGTEGPVIHVNYDPPTVEGIENNEQFISSYKINQYIPSFTSEEMTFEIRFEDIAGEPTNLSIENENVSEGEIEYIWNKTTTILNLTLSSETLMKLRGETLEILISVPLDREKQPDRYLHEGYLEVPIIVSNGISNEVTATAKTWALPWGDYVAQEVPRGTSTSELDAINFVDNLDNKLIGDKPYVIGFEEERVFDTIGDTSVTVIIESSISGIQNRISVPVIVIERHSNVFVHFVNQEGEKLAESEELTGIVGEDYETFPKNIENYQVIKKPENSVGVYSEENIDVTYIYDIEKILPIDPLYPESEINPENLPDLPENQGLLSIDFISFFNFGSQAISAQDQTYYAQPQRLLDEDGTVNETEERPNYIQISDRRPENERNGWQLAVTQRGQFEGEDDQELIGARLRLMNQQVVSAQNGAEPHLQQTNPLTLVPNVKRILLLAQGNEGTGTWVYRFGDEDTAGQSIALDVPKGATPQATRYTTTLLWELSAVPEN